MMAFNLVSFFRQPVPPARKAPVAPQSKTPKIASNKPVLVSLDLDGTLIPWIKENASIDHTAYLRYQDTLQNPGLKKDTFVVLNTGRSLSDTKTIAPILARFPFDALAVNDGQQLFVKPKFKKEFHPTLANEMWIRRLNVKKADPHWQKELQGWSTPRVLKEIRDELPHLDYQLQSTPQQYNGLFGKSNAYVFTKQASLWKSPQQQYWAISIQPDLAYMEIKRVGKKVSQNEARHHAQTLGLVLKNVLGEEYPNISFQVISAPDRCLLKVSPKGTNKASLANYLANKRLTNAPKAIISAGDYINDLPILSVNKLGHVPNYPILLGNHPEMQKELAQSPPQFLEQVGWNQLDAGIKKQMQKIRPSLPTQTPNMAPRNPTNGQLDQVG